MKVNLLQFVSYLSVKQKFVLFLLMFCQFIVNVLDLIAISLMGIVLSLSISGIQSQVPNRLVTTALQIFKLENTLFQRQVAILAIAVVILFVGKSVLSILLNKITFQFLSIIADAISGKYIESYFNLPNQLAKSRSANLIQYDLTVGIDSIAINVPGNFLLILADASLVLILTLGMLIFDPFIAFYTILSFTLLALVMTHGFANRSRNAGNTYTNSASKVGEYVSSSHSAFQELYLSGKFDYYKKVLHKYRNELTNSNWKINLYPIIGKYIFETSAILFAISLAAFQFYFKDAASAITSLAIFLTSSSRIAPAILRIQQSITVIHLNQGRAKQTAEYLNLVSIKETNKMRSDNFVNSTSKEAQNVISFKNVYYSYPQSLEPAIKDFNLEVKRGQFVAIVGPSGSGKSTFVKLLCNSDSLSSGEITIFGLPPHEYIKQNPGRIGYVPQQVGLINGTLVENITFKQCLKAEELERVTKLIRDLSLQEFVDGLPFGLNQLFNQSNPEISGGQLQRIGIARALFEYPEILILDEATSALDVETEETIKTFLEKIRGQVTIFVVAHRLSTIKNADAIYYIEGGKVIGSGTFEELRLDNEEFARQLGILGL